MKKLKRLLGRIPRLSRPQRILRNFAFILLLAVAAWFLNGAPALTARWGYRRAERLNLLEPAEIVDVVKEENCPTVVIAESGGAFRLWYDLFPYEYTNMTIEEKREPVSLIMPLNSDWRLFQVPWVLMTDLPAARGEVEFTLIRGVADQYINEDIHFLVEGERLNSGNFLFAIDCAAGEYVGGYYNRSAALAEHKVQTTLYYLSMARYNVQHSCQVDITVRLWDENGTLIYDEILRNGVEVIEHEN